LETCNPITTPGIIVADTRKFTSNAFFVENPESFRIEKSQNNWQNKLDIFNRILGGFAVMKIAKDEFENYSENYFDTLASINNIISNELKNQSLKISDKYNEKEIYL
jgi:hypothetical protein